MALTLEETKGAKFFVPEFTECVCVKVYDGDTIHVAARIAAGVYKFRVRLYGIDCPEIRSRDLDEKRAGFYAREILRKLVEDKQLECEILGHDKYGRLLCKLTCDGICVHTHMLHSGFACVYYGKGIKKTQSTDWCTKMYNVEIREDDE